LRLGDAELNVLVLADVVDADPSAEVGKDLVLTRVDRLGNRYGLLLNRCERRAALQWHERRLDRVSDGRSDSGLR
jgi:hypothetical protein